MTEDRTECDGWTAIWRIDHARIRMMHVATTTPGPRPLLTADTPTTAPDLVIAREQFPNLAHLWDAVRAEYWRRLATLAAGGGP